MTIPSVIADLPRGARFVRADLHIHSNAGSHDVKDSAATPSAIVQTASDEGLSMIAVADHNEISGVEAAVDAAQGRILVVPAVELSTPDGHVLCYLPSVEVLRSFHSQLTIVGRGTPDSRCSNGMFDCLERLGALGGFAVLAHIDADGGLEVEKPGASPHKKDILCHRSVLGLELKSVTSQISYSDADPDQVRRQIGRDRISRLKLGSKQYLARVLNSDSHSLQALGRNASGDKKVTRYKVNSLSFDSLRIALEDSDARVRIEEEIPSSVPYVRGIQFSGGFLDGQAIHLGPNLNCIIGGRGTGKSTTFEAIRCVAGQSRGATVIDSDVWPDQVEVIAHDQAGQTHRLARPKHGEVENLDDPVEGIVTLNVECYGQGETHEISKLAQNDPAALLEYLDRFVDVRIELRRENEIRTLLLKSQSEIEEAVQKVELIPSYERNLKSKQAQIAAVEKQNAREIITLQRKLEVERQAQRAITQHLQSIAAGARRDDLRNSLKEIKSAAVATELVAGANEFFAISAQVSLFENAVDILESDLKSRADVLAKGVKEQLLIWKGNEYTIQSQIDAKKAELEAAGVRVDIAYFQQLAADEVRLQKDVTALSSWKPHLTALRKQRRLLLAERWSTREKIAQKRNAFAVKATEALRTSLLDLNVSLKFETSAYSPEAAEIIRDTLGWRTVQVPRADTITQFLTVPKLLDSIGTKSTTLMEGLMGPDGKKLFPKQEARRILDRLSEPAIRFRLERAEVVDRPRLSVTKSVVDSAGNTQHRTREFRNLSLGQQQSLLLALMLSAESNVPLLIDQPEDNLDGEFIYRSIVPVLRRAKERRQVIIVTHNANIAVLGDAELIVVLRATNERALIHARGSIDDLNIREEACAILEGSREAFLRRSAVYGSV